MTSPDRQTTSSIKFSRPAAAGFSLLEIMIVVVIIGILVSIFTLSMGSFSDDATSEHARWLEALIDLATEEASMQGREIGLRFYQHGYEFSARMPDPELLEKGQLAWRWIPLEDDKLLRARDLGEEFAIDLIIEGKEVDLDYDPKEDEEYEPQIYLFSSGDLAPPFSARIRPSFSDHAILLSAEIDGKTEVKPDDF
jgi:general secretion pathway protein H